VPSKPTAASQIQRHVTPSSLVMNAPNVRPASAVCGWPGWNTSFCDRGKRPLAWAGAAALAAASSVRQASARRMGRT
jgi:hypothetical protein